MALAALPVMVAAPGKTAGEPVANANPASSGNDVDASKNVRADVALPAAPVSVSGPTPRTVGIDARMQSALVSPQQIALVPEPKIVADQTSQDASPEPKEVLAKNTVAAPVTGDVTAANAASGAVSPAAAEPVVLPNTPDGGGDPDTIVCRAPQRIAGTDRFGEVACGHNYEWQKLALNGKDLAPDDKTLIPKATVDNPTGKGGPDGVTCRSTGFLSPYPPLCRTNRFWANLIRDHLTVEADGVIETRETRAPWPRYWGGVNDYGATGF
jgi:hypothetical protein